jgi:hypothetical protein
MTSVSFGLGLALKLAGKHGDSAIALHYGSIELAEGPSVSARFTIMPPDSSDFYTLECFHSLSEENGQAYMGIILSHGKKGQLIDNPTYIQYIEEAYEIVRSLTIK